MCAQCESHIFRNYTKITWVLIKSPKAIFLMCLNILCQYSSQATFYVLTFFFFRKRIIIKPIRLTHTWKANCVIFQKCHTFGLSLAFHLIFKINLDLSAYFYDQMNDGDVRGESVDGHMYTLSSILPISTTIHSTHIFDNVMSPLYHHFRALIHVNKTKSYRERDFTLTITSETPLLLRE